MGRGQRVFTRYWNNQEHWETTGPVSRGYKVEGRWVLENSPKRDTKALYGCGFRTQFGLDHFLSTRRDCEGQQLIRREGWIHNNKGGEFGVPLYRCYWSTRTSNDHFTSTQENCENAPGGAKNEGLMGYTKVA